MQPDSTPGEADRRLESWKEIASYLNRDVRTVQRWEQCDGLPVHRLRHTHLASVYAYVRELDEWRTARERVELSADSIPLASPSPASSRFPTRARVIVACIALVAAVSAILMWATHATPGVATAHTIRTIAVLPIANFSGDAGQEYFADGMTDTLIARLSQVPGLLVISRTSAMQFKNSPKRLPDIARALGVDGVVEGSVTRSANRVRVTVKLIRAGTDTTLWADAFDRDIGDVLALQSDVALAIVRQVESSLSREDLQRVRALSSVVPEAFEHYLRGRFEIEKQDPASKEAALRHFQAAIERDPSFAPAHAAMAKAYNGLGTYFLGGRSPIETRPLAAAAARRALELDPDLVDALVALAYVEQREWRWAAAEAGYRRAIRLNPSSVEAHGALADLSACLGRFDEAVALARRARILDPLALRSALTLGMVLYFARRHDEATREIRAMTPLHEDDPELLWYLANSIIAAGDIKGGLPLLERSVARRRYPGPLGFLIGAYAAAGRLADAHRTIKELEAMARETYVPPAAFVVGYAGLGDVDNAFIALERAYTERSNLMRSLKVLPALDPLRSDPRYVAMLRRVGLE